jgi:glycosyltransferase involved in cell wall biosynthesis
MSRSRRTPHVLMTVANDLRTDARVCREAEALAAAGYRVTVLSVEPSPPEPLAGVEVVALKLGTTRRAQRLASQFVRLSIRTLTRRADVYHAHNVHMLPGAWLAARLRRKRLVYDAHELFLVQTPMHDNGRFSWKQRIEIATEKVLAPRADAMLTASSRYAGQMAQSLGVPPPLAIPNFPPLPDRIPRDSSPLRAATGASVDDVLLLYQGGFYLDTRALDVVIEAMPALPPSHRLAILGFGSPESEASLRRLAAASAAAERIHFLPSVPFTELPRWTAGADIGVIPFKMNSAAMRLCSPNKLYEYLGAGVAIVATKADELVSVLAETGAGETYDWDRPDDFARAVTALSHDPARLQAAKRRARESAETTYSWASVQSILVGAYAAMGMRVPTDGTQHAMEALR